MIKNVAGYDLAKLFAGSFGTLGAILEVAVRLHPLPRPTATALGRSGPGAARARRRGAHARRRSSTAASTSAGRRARPVLARFGGAAPRPQAEAAARLLREAGLDAELVEDDDGALGRAARRPARGRRARRVVRVSALQTDLPRAAATADRARRLAGRAAPPLGLSWVRLGERARRAVVARAARRGRTRPCSTARRSSRRRPVGRGRRRRRDADAAREGPLRPARAALRVSAVRRHPPARARPDRRLRALRLLPAHLPDVPALGRGDGLAARAHRADEAGPRGDLRPARRAHRQLPRLHGVRDRLPVGRAVRQADRGHARRRSSATRAPAARARVPAAGVRALHPPRPPARARARAVARPPPRAAQARRAGRASRRLAPRLATLVALRPDASVSARSRRLPERFEARGEKRGTVALLQGCVQRVFFGHVNEAHRAGARRRGLRGARAAAAALLRRAPAARRRRRGRARSPRRRSRRSRATRPSSSTRRAAARP